MLANVTFGYRPDLLDNRLSSTLNQFRWIAALFVCLGHLRTELFPDATNGLVLGPFGKAFYFVTLFQTQAVVVFFVISGLLVGGSILKQFKKGRFSSADYAIDRISRLYVVLAPAIVLSVALQALKLTKTCPALNSTAEILQNVALLQNFTAWPLCNNNPLWSLSSEAFFYIAAPAFLLGRMTGSRWAMLISAASVVAAFLSWTGTYMSPAFGLLLWAIGLAPWYVRLDIRPLAPLAVFLAILIASRLHVVDIFAAEPLIAISFAVFLSSRFAAKGELRRIDRIGASLAAFSYSLYLIHEPLGQALVRAPLQGLDPGQARSYLIFAAALAAIIGSAWIFGFLFERRTATLRRWLRSNLAPFRPAPPMSSRRGLISAEPSQSPAKSSSDNPLRRSARQIDS